MQIYCQIFLKNSVHMTLGSLKTAKELANALAYRRILKDLGDDPSLMPDDIPFGPQKGSEMGTGTWGWSGWEPVVSSSE